LVRDRICDENVPRAVELFFARACEFGKSWMTTS
jgi:hypothetical protein